MFWPYLLFSHKLELIVLDWHRVAWNVCKPNRHLIMSWPRIAIVRFYWTTFGKRELYCLVFRHVEISGIVDFSNFVTTRTWNVSLLWAKRPRRRFAEIVCLSGRLLVSFIGSWTWGIALNTILWSSFYVC